MPKWRWGIPDEAGCLGLLLALAMGPVFLAAGLTVAKWPVSWSYSYDREPREF